MREPFMKQLFNSKAFVVTKLKRLGYTCVEEKSLKHLFNSES